MHNIFKGVLRGPTFRQTAIQSDDGLEHDVFPSQVWIRLDVLQTAAVYLNPSHASIYWALWFNRVICVRLSLTGVISCWDSQSNRLSIQAIHISEQPRPSSELTDTSSDGRNLPPGRIREQGSNHGLGSKELEHKTERTALDFVGP